MLLWGGKNKVVVHDVVLKADNSLSIIAEGYSKNKKGKDKFIYTMGDLSIFDFNADGYFENARKIIKPDQEITVLTEENVRPLKMAMELNRMGYFPYKYHIEHEGKYYLVFSIIDYEKSGFMKIFNLPAKNYYFIPLESYGIEDATKVMIRKPFSGEKKGNFFSSMNNFNETTYDKMNTDTSSPVYNYEAMSSAQWINGKLVFTNYEFGNQTVRFWIEQVGLD
jgi:hypothetical protein